MPSKNLVSATLSAEDLAAVLAAIQTIKTKLPFLISLKKEERQALRKAASKRLGYIQDVGDGVKTHPTEFPASFDTKEYLKDFSLYPPMGEINSALASLAESVDDTRMQLGSELMAQSDKAYGFLKLAAKNNSSVKETVSKIGRAFNGQGKKKAAGKTPKGGGPKTVS